MCGGNCFKPSFSIKDKSGNITTYKTSIIVAVRLIDNGKQIVISADRAPGEIDGLENRIKSRLQSGLVVDLHPTDYELRLGILQSKAEKHISHYPEVIMSDGVLEFLAHRISTNVRVLEGALTRLFAFASLVGREVNLEMVQECLADILRASDRKVTIDEIKRSTDLNNSLKLNISLNLKACTNLYINCSADR